MNKNLQVQYDLLSQSTSKLNFVVSQFIIKMQEVSDQISEQFIKNKQKIKTAKKFIPVIDQYTSRDLIAYQDSLIHRFKSTYELTFQFLKSYAQEACPITLNSNQELLKICLLNNLITNDEHNALSKLSNEFENMIHSNQDEISEEIIHYCILMNNVVERFKINIQ